MKALRQQLALMGRDKRPVLIFGEAGRARS